MNKVIAFLMVLGFLATGISGVIFGTTCRTEDSEHCIWYGPIQGNGQGKIIINW